MKDITLRDSVPDAPDFRAISYKKAAAPAGTKTDVHSPARGNATLFEDIVSEADAFSTAYSSGAACHRLQLEQFQFETLRVSNPTTCRFAEKAQFFRSVRAGRRCAAASRFTFFKGKML